MTPQPSPNGAAETGLDPADAANCHPAPSTQRFEESVTDPKTAHLRLHEPSRWVTRFGCGIAAGGLVLDLACGNGRHGRWFVARGHPVAFVDITINPVMDLSSAEGVELIACDLEEAGGLWPLPDRQFAAITVVNYLHRPLFADMMASLEPGGMLIYETFAEGNERVRSRPRKPEHLLKSDELLTMAIQHGLQICAFEQGLIEDECGVGVKQRLAAIRRLDDEQRPLSLYPGNRAGVRD